MGHPKRSNGRRVFQRSAAAMIALAVSAAGLPLVAQEKRPPRVRPSSTQAASTQPTSTRPTTGPTSQPSDSPPNPANKISLNFKDAPLDTVLDTLSSAAGFSVIKDGAIDARVTVFSKTPVSASEAVILLGAVLKANGFTAIQEGRVLRIMARDKAKKGSIPVQFGDDPDAVSPTDELITQVISIHNIDAVKLRTDLTPLMSPDADVTATSGSNAIIVTDSSANIRRLLKIIRALDQREASASDIRVVQLKNANAAAAAKLIGEIFKGGGGGMSPQQIQMMQMQGQPIPAGGGSREGVIPGGGIDQALRGGKVTAAADERTNTLIVTGPKETLKIIDNMIKDLDANQNAGNTELRAWVLKNAKAEDTSKLITSIFKGEEDTNNNDDYYFGWGRRFNSGNDAALKVKITAAFDERTNSVIVTAPPNTLKLIDDLIKQLDTDSTVSADLKVFHLRNADSFDVSLLLEDIFKPKQTDNSNNDSYYYWRYFAGSNQNQKGPKMTAVSDDRTNSVIVTAPTEMLKAIEDVINQLDKNDASEESLFIYRLRNGQADNLEVVLNTLFGNIQNNQQGQNGQQSQDQQRQDQFRQNRENRGGISGSNRNTSNSNTGRKAGRGSNGSRRGNTPQMTPGLTRAVTELSGKVFVVADTDTNSLLITTASKYETQVRAIIGELDRTVPQVLIKVLVAEVTHNDDVDYGVDFSVLNKRPSGLGQQLGTNFGNASATGGLVVSMLETNVTATLHALATAGKLDVLSRPYILASDNQLASILVGQSIPRVTGTSVSDSGQQNTQVQHEDIGIILDVTPHINPDGQVILDVAPEISSLSDVSITVSPGVQDPILNKRSAQSRVEVMSGQTVVIGGLMEDRKSSTIDKVPFLGDIPVLGQAFRRTRQTKVKTELLIFLTPHVAEGSEGLESMSDDEMQGTKLTPNAVAPGMFQKHMRDMHRGDMPLTTQPTVAPTTNHSAPTTQP